MSFGVSPDSPPLPVPKYDESVMAADDGKVMPGTRTNVTVHHMATHDPITLLVVQEFRLRAADDGAAAARIVAASPRGIEPAIPLLTSIEDRRDVATVRALHAGELAKTDAVERASLDPLVSTWAAPKLYGPRVTERSQSPPSSFRLAVTESGINAGGEPMTLSHEASELSDTTTRPIGLVWIGAPVGTHAGLLVLLGGYDEPHIGGSGSSGWPLPLSHELGVRIYENTVPKMG